MMLSKKSLGQNFLIDQNIIKKIVNLVTVKNKNIVEIGPGTGSLTEEILKRNPKTITLIEKDYVLAKNLEKKFFRDKKIKVYNADILKFDIKKINKKNLIFLGNLPYNISSQILVKIIKLKKIFEIKDIVFMFQKELGEKIVGKYPSKNYGRLSILSNYQLNFLNKFLVSPNCFYPKPKVTSMVIRFQPRKRKNYKIKDMNNLEKITKILFSNKRKMINKNIKKILNAQQIEKIKNLNCELRPAEIDPQTYYKITEVYERK